MGLVALWEGTVESLFTPLLWTEAVCKPRREPLPGYDTLIWDFPAFKTVKKQVSAV